MEEFVRKVLSKYSSYRAEKELFERWLSNRENKEVREGLALVEMKVAMIQSWFTLLTPDERLIIEKHLVEELEWPRVSYTFSMCWKGEFTRTERTLLKYQATGLKKIIEFVEAHRDMVQMVFGDLDEHIIAQDAVKQ